MKKPIRLAVFAVLFAAALFVAGPFWSVHNIKMAIAENDQERLKEYVRFDVLRGNIKEQLQAKMSENAGAQTAGKRDPFGALGEMLAAKLIDGMVDTYVTPGGVIKMMGGGGKNPEAGSGSSGGESGNNTVKRPMDNASYGFDSMSTFSVRVPGEDGKEVRVVLSRDGLSWPLTNIVMP